MPSALTNADSGYDVVIRGGEIVDGTGTARLPGDIGVRDGRIAAIGEIPGRGIEEIDATGRIVTPGFVDIHTHYDGHATWTERLNPSSQHGVTTVVAGNCGVGFAPCKPEDRDRLIQLMEGVEDIPEIVMAEGLPWNWESFPDYLDGLAARHFDMDVATQIPHAPLRVYVMGDRAMTKEPATADEIARMRTIVKEAIEAGAIGFSTSRSLNHKASDGTLTPSYAAAADELAGIATGLGEAGKGVLQFISDFDDVEQEFEIARQMVRKSGRPLSISLMQQHHAPQRWREILDRIETANSDGLVIRGQVSGRPIGVISGFRVSRNPFLNTPGFREIEHLSDDIRVAALRDPARRARILKEFSASADGARGFASSHFANLYAFSDGLSYEPRPNESMIARAEALGQDSAAFTYDWLIAGKGDALLYFPAVNYAGNDVSAIETMLRSDHTILGLGDGGAHCKAICDASLPTYMLQRWSSAGKGPFSVEQVVKALTSETAETVQLNDRGRIAPGMRADLNVIDLDRIALHRPEMVYDLPHRAGRLGQPASGYDATIVAGVVTYRGGVATGALPGRLVRGSQQPLSGGWGDRDE